jgi:hypothetical protein
MKKRVTTLLIFTFLTIGSLNIQAKNIEINIDNTLENTLTERYKNNELTSCTGIIYGEVGNSHGVYAWTPCPFALVKTGLRRTLCNFKGEYKLSHLPLNRVYKVTAHYLGYKLTEYVKLTKEEPVKKLFIDMYGSEPVHIEPIENNPACFGFIFGITGGVFEHAS